MIFLLHIYFILAKSKPIIHNCDFTNANLITRQNESTDYIISCNPNRIQLIDLNKDYNITSVSIFNDSNVIISCSHNYYQNLMLSIYDTPNISIENNCRLNRVEIQGWPNFNLFENSFFSVDTVVLFNKDFQFKFDHNNIIYPKNDIKKVVKLKKNENNTYTQNHIIQCENNYFFNASLRDNYITTKCGNSYEYTFLYSTLPDYTFVINNTKTTLVNDCTTNESTNHNIETISHSLSLVGNKMLFFDKFKQFDLIKSYSLKNKQDSWVYIENDEICKYDSIDSSSYQQEIDSGWRVVCIIGIAYFHCCDSDLSTRKITYLSLAATLALIITIVCVIVGIIISLIGILYCKYNKLHASENEQTE